MQDDNINIEGRKDIHFGQFDRDMIPNLKENFPKRDSNEYKLQKQIGINAELKRQLKDRKAENGV